MTSHEDIYAVISYCLEATHFNTAWMLFLKGIHIQKSKTLTFSIPLRDKLALNSTFTQLKMQQCPKRVYVVLRSSR